MKCSAQKLQGVPLADAEDAGCHPALGSPSGLGEGGLGCGGWRGHEGPKTVSARLSHLTCAMPGLPPMIASPPPPPLSSPSQVQNCPDMGGIFMKHQ